MASASSSPPHNDDPFDLGPRTPSGLARGARVALLRNSPATREGEIGVSHSALRTAYTPSSSLHAVSYATATEGAQRAVHFDSSKPDPQSGDGPVSITNAANKLVVAQNKVYSANLAVFKAFCSSFDDTAKQFTSGPAPQFENRCLHRQTTSGSSPISALAIPTSLCSGWLERTEGKPEASDRFAGGGLLPCSRSVWPSVRHIAARSGVSSSREPATCVQYTKATNIDAQTVVIL